jgi:hypothetical protein
MLAQTVYHTVGVVGESKMLADRIYGVPSKCIQYFHHEPNQLETSNEIAVQL